MVETNYHKPNPLVTVITSCNNGEKHGMLNEYFESVLSQNYDNVDYIFINDGSTDDTENIFLKYKDELEYKFKYCRYIKFSTNRGYIEAINNAMDLAQGEYICLFDSDDIILPHNIKSHVEFLENHSNYAMVYSPAFVVLKDRIDKPHKITSNNYQTINDKVTPDDIILKRIWTSSGAYCFRKKCWNKIKPLSNYYGRRGQNLQILTAIAHHANIGFNDVKPVMKITVRSDSLSNSTNMDNLFFKTNVRRDLDFFLMEKYGSSMETIRIVKTKYEIKNFLYNIIIKDKKQIKIAYKNLITNTFYGEQRIKVFCLKTLFSLLYVISHSKKASDFLSSKILKGMILKI